MDRGPGGYRAGDRGTENKGHGDRGQGDRGQGDTGQRAVDMDMAEKVVHITHRARGHVATHCSAVIAIS